MTPDQLADLCLREQDTTAAGRIIRHINADPGAGKVSTLLTVVGYLLAELDRQAPQPGVVIPAAVLLAERAMVLLPVIAPMGERPAGHA